MEARKTMKPHIQTISDKELKTRIRQEKSMIHIPCHKQQYWELQGEFGRRELVAMGIIPRGTWVQLKGQEGGFLVVHDSRKDTVNVVPESAFKLTGPLTFETIALSQVCGF